MPMKMVGYKREEVIGGWRKFHNDDLRNLPATNRVMKSRKISLVGNVALMGEMRNARRVLVGKPDLKKPLGNRRHKLDGNMKRGLKGVGL
jgi:hypothetical protein